MGANEAKAMTLRLAQQQARDLEAVAEIDGVSVTDAVRSAIDAHIATRRADAAFQTRLRESLERHRDVLERLSR